MPGPLRAREAMTLLSDVKLGVELGIITNVDASLLKQLIVLTRPAHLQKVMGQGASARGTGSLASKPDPRHVKITY